MNDLLAKILVAHGGLEHWKTLNKVRATIVSGGGLLPMKGLEADPTPLVGTATTRTEGTVIEPFAKPYWRMVFTPDRVAIETTAGELVKRTTRSARCFCWSHHEYHLGPASPRILQWLRKLDILEHSIPDGTARVRGH